MNSTSASDRVSLYYDGLCRVCSREIEHYRGLHGADQINFVDIADPKFDAEAHGLGGRDVNREIHARDVDGSLHVGVDAFVLIWSKLNAFRWLSKIARRQPAHGLLSVAYAGFVRLRPYLPRKPCAPDGTCRI